MEPRALIRITLAAGLMAAVGAAGCSLANNEETGSSPDEVVAAGDVSALLKSTLVLEGGCTAAKVGPKHLLVAARCVSGNPAFAAGKTLVFTSATGAKSVSGAADSGVRDSAVDAAKDSGSAARDAGSSADAGKDSGTKDSGAADSGASNGNGNGNSNPASRDVTIAEVKIHPSWAAKCKDDLCAFNKIEGSDSPDIAIIFLENELLSIPSIPVDLDPVGQGDPLLVVTGGCTTLDGKAPGAPKTVKTIAVPAKSVNHAGGPYANAAQLVSRVAGSYVVTAGAGWRSTDPRFCKTDVGAPLFRAGSAAVAGVTSNYTTYADGKLPVTTHHTRVDTASRFKIGDWLSGLGVTTIHSCSETAGGCVKNSYDGGTPMGPKTEGEGTTQPGDTDGGRADATAPETDGGASEKDAGSATTEEPSGPRQETLPSEEPAGDVSGEEEDYSDAAAPKKKKKAAEEGGCSAAPGRPSSSGGLLLGLVIAAGAVMARRRRAR